ncbi:putative peptide alpha-n-acetyltransferase protein [Phaeoacremonium minimum UCRPA7]|uniref:Putative peptide alpha-n-acetyltransferase protein n=1 Tax=Phaeoacremonium minimum (strain UCR-PA7) TaxID=1286976 RepID=R8BTS5_PHAM7|nr:putative peptide alpha-n-acetyltransferase protein [Phaeoacremonium minimum UCRPA7]EOO02680.1 putative peptide alpha-n-acetyltransferase protein [Phaeoacremonium minimum UCRPA7]
MHELPLTLRNTAAAEHFVLSNVKKAIPTSVQDKWHEYRAALKQAELENLGDNEVSRDMEMAGWGVKEAEEANQTEASLATQLALAYAIHKSFIFVRVPLTAAVTPKVVKVLRGWGWQIGKRTKK